MSKKIKNSECKNIDGFIIDKGEQKNILVAKALEELGLKYILPARDRGDSKLNLVQKISKLSERATNPKGLKVNVEKRKPYDTITAANIIKENIETKKVQDDIEDRGDISKEKNMKGTSKLVAREKTDESKQESPVLLTGNVSEKATNIIENSSDADKFQNVTNHDNKKLEERVKGKVPEKGRVSDKSDQNNKYLDFEGRKRLREKYTFKNINKHYDIKVGNVKGNAGNDISNNSIKQPYNEITANDKSNESDATKLSQPNQVETTKPANVTKELPRVHRKPIIKTVMIRNDNRVFKAVKFVEKKDTVVRPLQIKIPLVYKRDKQSTATNTIKSKIKVIASKVSVQMKLKKEKSRAVKKRKSSPILLTKSYDAPPTEVAKWVPSCISGHTKPYYEAWVDTTPAVFSKCTKYDEVYAEKQHIIKTFKRNLDQRPPTPELIYEDFKDERFTGRITVRHNVKSILK